MGKTKSQKPLRAAIYTRISSDREGREIGVDRQQNDCRALCQRLGYEVVEVFAENDTGASTKSRKPRPLYAELIEGAKAQQWDVVVAYSTSRLTRRPLEGEALIALNERHGIQFAYVVSSRFDLSTADGRMQARIAASIDAGEAERTAERVARAKAENASKGEYRGGPRPYGFEKDGVTVRESEARVIREMSKAVLAGRSLASLTRELNVSGRKTAGRNGTWRYGALRDMLLRPRNAGLLAHGLPGRSKLKSGQNYEFEEIGKASWPAILPEDEWRAVVTLLTDPTRRMNTSNETKWLGSGIYRCAVPTGEVDGEGHEVLCGSPLRLAPHGGTAMRPYERRYLYRCTARAHLTIGQRQTDEFVQEVVADLVRDPRIVAALHPDNGHLGADRELRAVLAARLGQVERDFDDDLIDARRYSAKRDKINAEIDEVDKRMAQGFSRSASSSVLRAADPGAAFLAAPIDIQRAVLMTAVKVEVLPAAVRGSAWTSDRLRITPAA